MSNSREYIDVTDFHQHFKIDYPGKPRLLPEELYAFRKKFLYEELQEFIEAHEKGDLVKAFDSLIDLGYVLYGTVHLMGLPWSQGWKLVHQANMSKRRATSAAESASLTGRGSSVDIVKPEGWVSPEPALKRLIREFSY